MGERPLTQMQAEALRAVAAGEVKEIRCGTAAFRIFGASPTVIGRLKSMGLIEWTKIIGGEARLTDAGRAALSKAEGRSLSSASGQEGGANG